LRFELDLNEEFSRQIEKRKGILGSGNMQMPEAASWASSERNLI
jgi:hypothetical protein